MVTAGCNYPAGGFSLVFSGPGSVGPSAFSWSQVESLPGPGSRSVGPGPIGEAPAAPVRSHPLQLGPNLA